MGQNPFENLWLEKKRKSIVDRRGYSSLLPVEPMNSFPGIFEYVAKNAVWVYQQSFGYDRWRGYIVCTTNTLSNREKKEENKHQKKKKKQHHKKKQRRDTKFCWHPDYILIRLSPNLKYVYALPGV